jgi:glycosyltransferase involved in cell wall biosynthesis
MRASSTPCHVIVDRTAKRRLGTAPGEILAFGKCRNERLRLPAFLSHYRGLGVDRFFIVDNDSSDGTTEYLADQPDVRLFRTANRFSEASGGTAWLNALLAQFGVSRWCLALDIDELLVYPGSEQASLRTLTDYLDRRRYEALSCLLLDLYPAGRLSECVYRAGDNLLAAAPYFDPGPYEKSPVELCPGVVIRGGMRARIFYPEFQTRGVGMKIYDALLDRAALRAPILRKTPWLRARRRRNPPCLTKVPLIRWHERSEYMSPHWVAQTSVAPETGVLLHFKFLHDFSVRAVQEAARGEYYDEAFEYRTYVRKLTESGDMSFTYAESTRFEGTTQLVRLGIMQDTNAWADARATRRLY